MIITATFEVPSWGLPKSVLKALPSKLLNCERRKTQIPVNGTETGLMLLPFTPVIRRKTQIPVNGTETQIENTDSINSEYVAKPKSRSTGLKHTHNTVYLIEAKGRKTQIPVNGTETGKPCLS